MKRQIARGMGYLFIITIIMTNLFLGIPFHLSKAIAASEVIVAGIFPFTGPNAAWGIRGDRGMRYVFDLINAQGGIKSLGGAKFKYVSVDTESKPDVAGSQAEKIVAGEVSAIFGCQGSSMAIVVSQIAERKQIPFIDASDIDPLITGRGFKYVFRTVPIIRDSARTLIIFADAMNKTHKTNYKKVGILCEDSIAGDSASKSMEKHTRDIGYTVIDVVKYNAATTKDFTGVLSRYKAQGVEILVGHNKVADSIQIVRNCKEIDFNPAMIGGISGGWAAPDFLQNLGPLAEGIAIGSPESSVSVGKFDELKKEYETKYKEGITSTFIGGCSAAWLLYVALEACGSKDPRVIANALRKVDIKYGDGYFFQQFGCKFDEKGDNTRASAAIFQVRNGIKNSVFPPEYATDKPIWPKPRFK